MAHRHPTRLNAEHVAHPTARQILKAELANCAQCRTSNDETALNSAEVMESLLRGFMLKRAAQWRTPHSRYPTTLLDLAPPAEIAFLNGPTKEVARCAVIGSRSGDRVDTSAALEEIEAMGPDERRALLDDLIDGILDGEA